MPHMPSLKLMAASAALAGLLLGGAAPALAHATPKSMNPAADAAIAVPLPSVLTITFSEPFELTFTKIAVTGADGTAVPLGPLSADPADGSTLVVPLAGPLPAGVVTVTWSTVAADGHKSNGSYHFSVAN